MKSGRDPLTLAALHRRFDTEEKALAWLEKARWPEGPVCPACGSINRASRITTLPGRFTCLDCKRRFSVTAGTPMHKTHLPLTTWIIAAYLLAASSKGISSLRLSGMLGLQYRTTWHLTHRLRAMMTEEPALLRGIVELDETFVGGGQRPASKPTKPAPAPLLGDDEQEPPARGGGKKRRKGRGGGKAMAFTMVERGGHLVARPLASHGTADFWPSVRDAVARDAIIATDELPAYRAIGAMQAGHLRVNHSAGEYASTDAATGLRAHVNTAESVHSGFKRAIIGV